MRETVVLIGAGSAMFTRGLVSDLIRAGWQADLRLVDTDPAALRVAEGLARKMVEMYGAPIAVSACLDRHVTEFFPQFFAEGRYYGRTLGVDAFSFEETIALGDRIYGEMQQAASSPQPLGPNFFDRLDGEHEQVVEIVESIRCHASRVYSVNVPNVGQVANLPLQAIIECPAAAHGEGLSPIVQPMLSPGLVGTLASHLAWVETAVEAALEGSRDKFIQALVIDGAVNSIETAATIADELLAAHAPYLPQFA